MSSFFKPNKTRKGGFSIKPKGAATNRLRDAVQRLDRQMSVTGSPVPEGPAASNVVLLSHKTCPNPQCSNPSAPIEEGFCTGCGRQVEAVEIVNEVQFGENAAGAAVLQGSYMGADQAAARLGGPGMRRIGGVIGDSRERVIREARTMMTQYASQLKLSDTIINEGIQIFKLALSMNWIQGRGMIKVVPVCLYAACRRQERCRVMLIDFADLVRVNVYELGHVFKALNDIYDFSHNKIKAIIPEDLMYRFCDKLDFGDMTRDVAELSARFCQRMGLDWMVMGRRPSGICGACIFLAAQVWGFRRTVREIVYVVKVTMHTIEQRLDEFKIVESSDLTIEDFLKQELLESRHDPPSFYRKQAEYLQKMEQREAENGRKRKRVIEDIDGDKIDEAHSGSLPSEMPPPRRSAQSMPPPPLPPPDTSKLPQVTEFLERTKDPETGQMILEAFDPDNVPAPAPRITAEGEKEVAEGVDAEDPTGEEAIDHLAETYTDDTSETAAAKRRRGKRVQAEPLLTFNEEWEQAEDVLAQQIDEVISDPSSDQHRKALATAAYHARVKAAWARSQLPVQETKMDEVIDPEEFADDPEVQNCLLGPAEIQLKEQIWLNTNKDWLRKQQNKLFEKEMEKLGPKKKKRNRLKKPRIGEGQLTPASTPGEAAVATMKKFTMSSRINLDAIKNLFSETGKGGPGSVAQSSRADSEYEESEVGDDPQQPQPHPKAKQQGASQPKEGQDKPGEGEDEEEEEEEDEAPYEDDQGFGDDYQEYDEGEEEWF
ncbi:transcription factor tfiiib complex subunit brf1 [Seiridium cupressi]